MDLTHKSYGTYSLIKNANGTLRIGRWWYINPNAEHFISQSVYTDTGYRVGLVSSAAVLAKGASSWTTKNASEGFFSPTLGTCFSQADEWAEGRATMSLFSFTVPEAVRSRTIRAMRITCWGGGCTLLEWDADENGVHFPMVADTWPPNPANYSGLCGFRFSTSKPSSPNSVSSTPHTNVYFSSMTVAAINAGASIVLDSSGYWTYLNGGLMNISTPAAVPELSQGAATIWIAGWPIYNSSPFVIPSSYSRVEHSQSARMHVIGLYIYA